MLKQKPVILEVATEMAFQPSHFEKALKKYPPQKVRELAMSESVGGIGPLMRERILEQNKQGVDVVGVTLLYDYVWVQKQDSHGQLKLEKVFIGNEHRSLLKPSHIHFPLTLFNGRTVHMEVFETSLGSTKGYYLACREVKEPVYPGYPDAPKNHKDPGYWVHERRLICNWILGRGSLLLAKELNLKPAIIILSETPTIFAIHHIFQDALQHDSHFSDTAYLYNDHTPLEYAHPLWDQKTVDLLGVDPHYSINTKAWNKKTKHLDVTSMAVQVCEGTFGVSRKHEKIIKAMPSLSPFNKKITSITNGVRAESWQAPEFSNTSLPDQKLLDLKDHKKQELMRWLYKTGLLSKNWMKNGAPLKLALLTRRITSYKRLDIIQKLLFWPKLRREFLKLNIALLIGGRIHQQDNPSYEVAAGLVQLIQKHKELRNHVVFLKNFNVWEAPLLYQGVDMAIMMSDNEKEASSTGFMKALMNGAAVVASSDGAVPEFVEFGQNGFEIPYVNNHPTPEGVLKAFKEFNSVFQSSKKRAHMIRSAIAKTPQMDVSRTVRDMRKLYQKTLQKKVTTS